MKRLLLLIGLCAAACGPLIASEAITPTVPVITEEPFYAPDFTLASLDGPTYTLRALRGQWVIVNFWATWCTPCRAEMAALQALAQSQADDLVVLGINQREPSATIRPFVAEYHLTFPILINPDDATLLNYNVMSLPQTVVVDPAGIVVWRQFGPIQLETFADTLTALRRS